MPKKKIYIILLIVFGYFIYTIFFKTIDDVKVDFEKEIRSKKVTYQLKDEALIYAEEQIGSNNDKKIEFNGVVIDFLKQNMEIKADFAEVDPETVEVKLTGNVFGETKDKEWSLTTEEMNYRKNKHSKDADLLFSNKRTTLIKDDNTEFQGDRIETTTGFDMIKSAGNVVYRKDGNMITADSARYYTDKKQVDASGGVKYDGADFIVTGGHIFYDDAQKLVRVDGNGAFDYKTRDSKGSFASGTYDLKDEVLTTDGSFILNYDGYKLTGTALNYALKSGNINLRKPFTILKENLKISGVQGKINTIEKNIFAEKIKLDSTQGDEITANIGEGSFEKKEFRFDGKVKGEIRSNIKDFLTQSTKLNKEEAIKFSGDTAKIYFLPHKNNEMSITRSELKGNVFMEYKNFRVKSEYNEIDANKNLVLARDKIIVDLKNEIHMTSNFLYYDLNAEKGTAENNVKISSASSKISNVNMNAKKAEINMKTRKIHLEGDVSVYQGKNKSVSEKATYDIDKKTLENNKNTKIRYEVQTENKIERKSDLEYKKAVEEVLATININQDSIQNKKKIALEREKMAKNGILVGLKWESSNKNYFNTNGDINKGYYGSKDKTVDVKVVARAGSYTAEKEFRLVLPSETVMEMLERASKNLDSKQKASSVEININTGIISIPVVWEQNTAILKYGGKEYRKTF